MEKAPLPPEEPVVRPESTVTLEDSDFESHEEDDNVVYTPRSSHFGDAHPDLPPSYDESQAAHAEAQAQARSQLLPRRENHSDVTVYRTELPPDPNVSPREGNGKEPRAPSPQSGPSILLTQALSFTQELPATDARYAHELTRPIAIPSLPGNVEPMKFARFYATILHHHSISPAQFMDFIDGLNALAKACSANPAYLRGMDPGYEILNENITSSTLISAYVAQTNHAFFAPRGLQVRIFTLNELADIVCIPTTHGIRHNMLSEAIRAYAAGAEVPTAANGAATATAQTLEPYIEPLSFAVPEPRTTIEALNNVAARFANLSLSSDTPSTARPGPLRSRSIGSAIAGPSTAREGEAGPSSASAHPLWHPHTIDHAFGGLGDRQGKFRGDWANQQSDFWSKWGEAQGEKWSKWGEQQGEKWSKWGDEFGKKWEQWGENLGKKMGGGYYPEGLRSTPASSGAPMGAGPAMLPEHTPPNFWNTYAYTPTPAPTPAGQPPNVVYGSAPMPGTFPIAPGPRGAMIAAMAARARGSQLAAAGLRGGFGGRRGGWGHGQGPFAGLGGGPFGAHAGGGPFGGRGGFRGGFGGGRGGGRGGRFVQSNSELEKEDEDDSDSSSVSSSSTSSTETTTVSSRSDPDMIFAKKVSEIEKYAADARAKGKKKEEDIEGERQKALRKANDERAKGQADLQKRKDKKRMKAELKALGKEWKRNLRAEKRAWKKQFREERRAAKAERRHGRRDRRDGELRNDRHDRRRREWDARWDARKRDWDARREQLERGRRALEQRWDSRRRAWEQNWDQRRREQESVNENRQRELDSLDAAGVQTYDMPGAFPEGQDQGLIREETNLSGADDIMWVVIGNLEG